MTFKLAIVFAVMLGVLPRSEAMAADAPDAPDVSAGHITGLGGIFIKSKDPKALSAWYRDVLGMPMESWGGAALRYDAPGHPPVATWNAFSQNSKYMAPSTREFMLDFAVDDMDAIVAKLTAKGVPILKRDDSDPSGKFAWIMDPDGTKIELWQPPH
ncbi:MAG TPA: VOC family protein [Rhizomicrobium sp.]|jgi:catechol 2,3-dioxygenase-like lactoylglutathione lyase family enzyme|nr:VOC family protein [Rhizomicrobium sp.]